MDYSLIAEKIRLNGEPGLCWLDNMKAYGRMIDPPNFKDIKAAGGNPCLE
jgi:ribonucleoside-triphosphate reductase